MPCFCWFFVGCGDVSYSFLVCLGEGNNKWAPICARIRFWSYRALAAGLWAGRRPRPPTVFARLYGLANSIIGNYSF
jgi:hypothetical protein